jgi:uncharacterized protein
MLIDSNNNDLDINEELINLIRDKIVYAVSPEKIVLFGSYAYGKPDKNSDLDLLIVMNTELPKYKRAIPILKELSGIIVPKDIVVYTEKEIEEWADVPLAFITTALNQGKLIYEKGKD